MESYSLGSVGPMHLNDFKIFRSKNVIPGVISGKRNRFKQ
jgi:hypothetical protein